MVVFTPLALAVNGIGPALSGAGWATRTSLGTNC
jgi:hypothetical protein